MIRIGSFILLSLMLALLGAIAGAQPKTGRIFYVAVDGRDSWAGALPEPNADRTDGPFATLSRARDAVREFRSASHSPDSPAEVQIRRGTYFLAEPLVLEPQDSGVSYSAYHNERVVISGGRPITSFHRAELNGRQMLAADLPEVKEGTWNFAQLFVNGRRRPRTRLPKEGFYQVAELIDVPADAPWNKGQDRFKFNGADLKPWRNLQDVDVVALTFWIESRMRIKSVDGQSRTVVLGNASRFRLTRDFARDVGAPYFVENVSEALDTPGQWYLDRGQGVLYYYPFVGEDTATMAVVAPKLEQVVRVIGDAKGSRPVTGISFTGLRFAHTEHHLPADRSGSAQAAFNVPGALYFERAQDCAIRGCEIAHVGTYAVEFGGGCRNNCVDGSTIFDMGAGGVKVNEGSESITISDNEIRDGGKIFMSAVGVWIGNSPHNRVLHNSIHDLYYTGVSVGWRWGYGESKAADNAVEHNHIYSVGRGMLSDLGGIYTLGVSPGTRLRNNLIHDCISRGYGGWGIYTDEGSSDIVIENNVVYRTKTGGFHQHYGKENVLTNNIFALSKEQQLQRSRQEEHTSFIFQRNIVYYEEGQLLGSNWGNDHYKMDYNLYYDASGRPITFAGATLDEWRQRGHGAHSIIADPMFVDPLNGDFTLKPGSPAFELGFKQIDTSTVGPRRRPGPQR